MMLPFIMGVLATTVPGEAGFGSPSPTSESPNEPGTILVLLNVGAIFMGTALTIRTLIGERAIFLREQAVGLSTTAYIFAKMCVFTVFAVLQATIAVAITVLGKGAPTQGAVMLKNPTLELWFDVAFTCVAAAMVGLALSALARSNEQIMPLLVVAIMSSWCFGRHDPGDRAPCARPAVMVDAGPLGFRRVGVDGRSVQAGSRSGDTEGLALETHAVRVDVRRWDASVICVGYATFVRWRIRLKS